MVEEDGEEDAVMHIEGGQAAPALPTRFERYPMSDLLLLAFENLLSFHVMMKQMELYA